MQNKTEQENTGSIKKSRWLLRLAQLSMLFLLLTLFAPLESEASHYRYGNISWARASGSRTVTYTVTQAWRRSFPTWAGAGVGTNINTGVLLFGDGASATI